MKTLLVLVLTLAVLSQVNSTYSRGSIFSRLYGAPEPEIVQESKTSTVSQQTVHTPTPASVSSESSESSSSSTSSSSSESTESSESSESIPSEEAPVEEAPVEEAPVEEAPVVEAPAATICQPYQKEVNGVCVCDNDRCNDFQSSHLCTEESAAGICQCNSHACAKNNLVCSENSLEGNCVECTDDDIQECRNHQTCFLEHCVCIDHMCQDDLICEREYSATEICVECRENSDCGDFQICDDFGDCVCRDELCEGEMVCSSEDKDGECSECREGQTDFCEQFQGCMDDNVCGCDNELCPQYTLCNQETEDGVCSQSYICITDDDCSAGSTCVELDDAVMPTALVPTEEDLSDQDILVASEDNLCNCDPTACSQLSGEFTFGCLVINDQIAGMTAQPDFSYDQICLPAPTGACTPAEAADFTMDGCPDGFYCSAIGSVFGCLPSNLPCRAENGVLIDGGCVGAAGCTAPSAILDLSPFCAPSCDDTAACNQYPCSEGFEEAPLTFDTGACIGDSFDGSDIGRCACSAIVEEEMEEM